MKRVEAVIRPERLEAVQAALAAIGVGGITVSDVRGHGHAGSPHGTWRGDEFELSVVHKIEVKVLCEDGEVADIVGVVLGAASTGRTGDGLVFVHDVNAVYPIRAHAPAEATP